MTDPMRRAWVEVDLSAVRANVRAVHAAIGAQTQIMAVVKADAYGHGLLPVAQSACEAGATWLGVATVAEGLSLREAGLTTPIALLCALAPDDMREAVLHDLTLAIGDRHTLRVLDAAAQTLPSSALPLAVHLDIDTGIGRSGVAPCDAVALWRECIRAGLRVTGLTTHFADGLSDVSRTRQVTLFSATLAELREAGASFDLIHLSNSEAALRAAACSGTLVRPGLLLYGIMPRPEGEQESGRGEEGKSRREAQGGSVEKEQEAEEWKALEGENSGAAPSVLPFPLPPFFPSSSPLLPALELKARIGTVRELPAGHPISYGETYHLTRPSRVATVLLGYGDGYPRRLSNCGAFLIEGSPAPILGRVCMDQTVVDVTDIPDAAPGGIAVAIGKQGREEIRVEALAALVDTTEHEITTGLSARLPRVYLSS